MKAIEDINEEIAKLRLNGQRVKNISDGRHTFGDYIEMRNTYFVALCNAYSNISWKSKRHFDEENNPMYNGDFIAGIMTPVGPIAQHLKLKYWDDLNVREIDRAPQYNGYNEDDIKKRFKSLSKGNDNYEREQNSD